MGLFYKSGRHVPFRSRTLGEMERSVREVAFLTQSTCLVRFVREKLFFVQAYTDSKMFMNIGAPWVQDLISIFDCWERIGVRQEEMEFEKYKLVFPTAA